MPVVINVPATDYEFEFGGPSSFDTPYNNDVTGVSDKYWRFEVGDWGIFWSLPEDMPDPNANLMASVSRSELPTDINVHVLAPVAVDPMNSWHGIFDEPLVSSGVHWSTIEYSVPAVPGVYVGAATFGFLGANDMFSIEVVATAVE